jgi:hypothetical protein
LPGVPHNWVIIRIHLDPLGAAMLTFEISLTEQIMARDWQCEPDAAWAGGDDGLVIEDLDHAAPFSAAFTLCG